MIDFATLTPETIASLGYQYAALYTDNEDMAIKLFDSGRKSGDYVWRLPMGKYFNEQIVSKIADIKNLGNEGDGENGAAAEFLKQFVAESVWVHLDIAGVAFKENSEPADELRVSGYGVKLLEEFIASYII